MYQCSRCGATFAAVPLRCPSCLFHLRLADRPAAHPGEWSLRTRLLVGAGLAVFFLGLVLFNSWGRGPHDPYADYQGEWRVSIVEGGPGTRPHEMTAAVEGNTLRIGVRGKAAPTWVLTFDPTTDPVRLTSPTATGIGEKSMWRKDDWYVLLSTDGAARTPGEYKEAGRKLRKGEVYIDLERVPRK